MKLKSGIFLDIRACSISLEFVERADVFIAQPDIVIVMSPVGSPKRRYMPDIFNVVMRMPKRRYVRFLRVATS